VIAGPLIDIPTKESMGVLIKRLINNKDYGRNEGAPVKGANILNSDEK